MGKSTIKNQPLIAVKQTKELKSFQNEFDNFIYDLPDAIIEVDLNTRQITYFNRSACDLFGYEEKDVNRGFHLSKLFNKEEYESAIEIVKSYVLDSFTNKTEYIRSNMVEHYNVEMKKNDGSTFTAEVRGAFILDKNNVPTKLRALIRDVTAPKHISDSYDRQGKILEAISYGTHLFLEKPSWGYFIQELVNRLGKATEVSRIYVFENHSGPNGELLTSQRYEWVDTGIEPQIDNPELQNFPWQEAGFSRWVNTLKKGEIISGSVRDFPESEREILEPQEIISILVAPISISDKWWGFIGFDDCTTDREWSVTTQSSLKTAADMIGATLLREQSEAALAESEEKHRSILENMEEGYFELDISGRFTYVNNTICKLAGVNREDILGMDNRDYTTPETAERMYKVYNLIYKTGQPAEITDYEIILKDGRKLFLELSASLILNPSGQPSGFRGMARDITEKKQREEQLNTAHAELNILGLTIANMNESVSITNQDHQFIFINKAFEKTYGYRSEDILGKTTDILTDSSSLKKVTKARRSVDKKDGWRGEMMNMKKDGTMFPIELSTTSIKDDTGNIIANIGIATDITDRKNSERALKQSEQTYKSLSEKLTETNTMKELLLDVITHDLLNPAGVISGMSELLMDEFPNNEMVSVIKDSSESLIKVVENATTLSKLSLGEKIKMEDLDLTQIIKKATTEFSSQLNKFGMKCEFKLAKTILIKANPIIDEVFKNYISNAIRYSSNGKRIIFESKETKSAVTINVIDFGPTVPKDKQELIFEREFQLENETGVGKGLGLAIVKRIAMAHNAKVGVKPNKPKGNIFYITIPKN